MEIRGGTLRKEAKLFEKQAAIVRGHLSLLIGYVLTCWCLCCLSSKGYGKDLTSTDLDFSGKVMSINRNIVWLNGTSFVDQKTRGAWVLKYWILVISVYSANGCLNLFTRVCGRSCCTTNIFRLKLYHLPFGKVLCKSKMIFLSFSKGSFVLGNSWALVFGRFMAWWHASILTVSIFIWYCAAKDIYVAHFLSEVQLNIGFRLNSGTKWTAWLHLVLQTFLMSHILLDVSWPPQVSFCLIYACGHVEWTQ